MAEPVLPEDLPGAPSKGGLDAPAFVARAAPTAGSGAEAPGAVGKEGPLPEPSAPLQAPEIGGPAPTTPARAAPLSAAPPSPIAALRSGAGDLLRAGLAGQAATGLGLFIGYLSIVPPITWLAAIGRQLGRSLVPRSGSLLGGAHFLLALLFPLSGVLLVFAPWSFAERGALASPAARALNIGMLLASLIHTAVELRMMEGAPAGFLLPVNLSTWVFAGLASAASLVAGGRPADLVAEMKEVAEGVKKRE
ncbi:hypothetical protein COHA_007211 [Chlorella ohadii]|uniref:Uncharacterized protein n=1 Tax=Chlorella ohadii TaxID=2649997 RepID=A0AAD5DRE5_9CHLO|nr:hypothetical protein COHA_007211 [Chlorella ohadii]